MNNITHIILLLVLLTNVNSQGGGGGGGSSGGGGGGGSGGGGGGADYVGDQGESVSCDDECADSENRNCVSECENRKIRTIVIVISCALGIPGLIGLTLYFKVYLQDRKKDQQERFRLRQLNHIPYLGGYTDVDSIDNQIVNFKKANWKFTYQQQETTYTIDSFSWNIYPTNCSVKHLFTGSGNDFFGSWSCEGQLQFTSDQGIQFWMLKDYKDKSKAGQTGDWKYLIYSGQYDVELKEFKGNWYYENFRGNQKYSGLWQLRQESTQLEFQ